MEKISDGFERIISFTLLTLCSIYIIIQTAELLWGTFDHLYTRFTTKMGLEYNPEYSRTIMIMFFNILLMLEIMQTIKVFNKSYTVKLRIILLVCLIAVSRKIFLLDIEKNAMLEFSTAALILAIAIGYFLITRSEVLQKLNHDED